LNEQKITINSKVTRRGYITYVFLYPISKIYFVKKTPCFI
jgi:hypothetical protein